MADANLSGDRSAHPSVGIPVKRPITELTCQPGRGILRAMDRAGPGVGKIGAVRTLQQTNVYMTTAC